jgi:hypothetical protein
MNFNYISVLKIPAKMRNREAGAREGILQAFHFRTTISIPQSGNIACQALPAPV